MVDLTNVNHSNATHLSNNNYVAERAKKAFVEGAEFYGYELDPAELEDSLLNDISEEVASSRDNSKQTKLSNRKQSNAEHRTEERLKKLRENVVSKVGSGTNKSDIQEQANKDECTTEDLIKRAKEYGGHAAELYAFLMDMADEQGDPKKAELFKNAATQLYQQEQSSIDAVINAMSIEQSEFAGLSSFENAKNYDAILNFKDSYGMLEFISQ